MVSASYLHGWNINGHCVAVDFLEVACDFRHAGLTRRAGVDQPVSRDSFSPGEAIVWGLQLWQGTMSEDEHNVNDNKPQIAKN